MSAALLATSFLALFPALLDAQAIVPSGAEKTLTGARRGEQVAPSVSLSPTGGFLVWEDNTIDGTNGTGIGARRLGADWTPVSDVFRINEKQPGDQLAPQAVQLAGGNTLVAWHSRLGAKNNILIRLLDPSGSFLTKELQIDPPSTTQTYRYKTIWQIYNRNKYRQRTYRLKDTVMAMRELASHPVAAALPDGSAVLVYDSTRRYQTNTWGIDHRWKWTGMRNLTNSVLVPVRIYTDLMQEIFFQRISATGEKVGPEINVNQYAEHNQRTPAVAVLDNGNFVVAWVSEQPGSAIRTQNYRVDIYARLYNVQGEPLGPEFLASGDEESVNANPAVGALSGGGFTIAWSRQQGPLTRNWDVVRRSFNASAASTGSIETVNQYTQGNQFAPRICSVGDQQLLVWTSVGQDGAREGVFGRLYSGAVPGSDEFPVNTTTAARQFQPALGTDGQGRFLAVWSGYTGANGFDLFNQSYAVSPNLPAPAGGGIGAPAAALAVTDAADAADASLSAIGSGAAVGVAQISEREAVLRVGVSGLLEKGRLSWNTRPGVRYQVEVSRDLDVWMPLGPPRVAAGDTDTLTLDRGAEGPVGFYRVTQLPPVPTLR